MVPAPAAMPLLLSTAARSVARLRGGNAMDALLTAGIVDVLDGTLYMGSAMSALSGARACCSWRREHRRTHPPRAPAARAHHAR